MNSSLADHVLEFLECAIHSILYLRNIYPEYLFEQRRYLGILVWKSRHPDINIYVRRVLNNSKVLIEKGILERIVVISTAPSGNVLDHISIKCVASFEDQENMKPNGWNSSSHGQELFEEFRSSILRIRLLDAQLQKLPEDCNWNIMAVTKKNYSPDLEATMQDTLTSGEWYIDNNCLTEQVSLARKVQQPQQMYQPGHTQNNQQVYNLFGQEDNEDITLASPQSIPVTSSSSFLSQPKAPQLIPVKSFRNDFINMSIYVHVF